MIEKVALYCRVSREDLNNENQINVLKGYCERNGFDNFALFQEVESSRKTRPVKEDLLQKLRSGEYNTLIFTRLDRFARSSIELITNLSELVNSGIRVIVVQQGLDLTKNSSNSVSMLQLQIFGAFAEFERSLISERTKEGLSRAKSQGKKLGRPRKLTRESEKEPLPENTSSEELETSTSKNNEEPIPEITPPGNDTSFSDSITGENK